MIGELFTDFRFRSFFIGEDLVCRMLVLFFQVSNVGWISLSIDEGIATFSLEKNEPSLLGLDEIDDEFSYPVQNATNLEGYIGSKIINVYEYRLRGIEDGCVGVYFECEKKGFSVVENDGCLSVTSGVFFYSDDIELVSLF